MYTREIRNAFLLVFTLNAAIATVRFAVLRATESNGIFADFLHAVSDAGTSLAALAAFLIARRGPTPKYPYGFGRLQNLFIFLLGTVLIVSAILLPGRESVERIVTGARPDFTWFAFSIFCATILGSVAITVFQRWRNRRFQSSLFDADMKHTLTDVFVSSGVAIGFLAVSFGYPIFDPIAGLLAAAFVIVVGALLMRENFRILMNAPPPEHTPHRH